LALVTNKDRQVTQRILQTLGLDTWFRVLYAGGDGPLKPSPEPVLRVCATLGIAPHDSWLIGDGTQDVEAARAAKARAIAVSSGFCSVAQLRGARPDALFASLAELMDAVDWG